MHPRFAIRIAQHAVNKKATEGAEVAQRWLDDRFKFTGKDRKQVREAVILERKRRGL